MKGTKVSELKGGGAAGTEGRGRRGEGRGRREGGGGGRAGGELEVGVGAGGAGGENTRDGKNKMLDEVSRTVSAGVGHIVADSFGEIARLAYLTDSASPGGRLLGAPRGPTVRPKVLVRVTTGVEAHTHEFMATAHDDQKFGFSLASGAAHEAVRPSAAAPRRAASHVFRAP